MFWVMVFVYYVLPPFILFELFRGKFVSKWAWLLELVSVGLFIAYLFVIGRWDIVSYYLRFFWVLVYIGVAIRSFFKTRSLPAKAPAKDLSDTIGMGIRLVLIAFFGFMTVSALIGYVHKEPALSMQTPLKKGVYYTGHGGAATSINYHHAYPSQAYALDIVQLNSWGTRSKGWQPKSLKDYKIYGSAISSPCTGKVLKVKDGLKEIPPAAMDKSTEKYREKNPAGNHVILECQKTEVHIAHMIPGSIKVKKGESVAEGHAIGRVGNSGNTSEPHLHLHAERNGEGVPITIRDRFLKRNSLLFE